MLIKKFDPWNSKLCTCPFKLSLNPYTGCEHSCVYCYASSYIPNFFNCRPKKDLIPRLVKEAKKLKGEMISISNSSDPYPSLEKKLLLTRKCLEVLSNSNCKIQIITKSTLVTRDVDILKRIKAMVAMTITTINDKISRGLEPNAPPSSERIEALKILIEENVPVAVRIDPIIPYLNEEQEELIDTLASIGVKHVTSSTYKVKKDNWQRFSLAFPLISEKLKDLYFKDGERFGRSFYLPRDFRFKLMNKIKDLVEKKGMKFGCCREGFRLSSASCDGSWLIS
ncbi:MAG: radical SAM protein [Candidatus Aenigmarchaeota archaeon]|nr:radical SAM protein [Candidatus Aenigmarchaeota archaeon]